MTPLRFAITSPPSGCEEDLHLQAIEHARRTKERGRAKALPLSQAKILWFCRDISLGRVRAQ